MIEPTRNASRIAAPDWWPCMDYKPKTPITHLYRSMRVDGNDLVDIFSSVREFAKDSDNLCIAVIRAVARGSQERSPFLHASTSISAAHRFSLLGHAIRSEEAHSQVFVKIDIWSWYQSGTLTRDMIIDLSSDKAH